MFRAFLSDEGGATSIEYALIASLIAMAIVIAIIPIGTNLSSNFNNVGVHL